MISKITSANIATLNNKNINFSGKKQKLNSKQDVFIRSPKPSVTSNDVIEFKTGVQQIRVRSTLAKYNAQKIAQTKNSVVENADTQNLSLKALMYDVKNNGFKDFNRNGLTIKIDNSDPSAITIDEISKKSSILTHIELNPSYGTTKIYKNFQKDKNENIKASEYFEFDSDNLTQYIKGFKQNSDGDIKADQSYLFTDKKLIQYSKGLTTHFDRSESSQENIVYKNDAVINYKKGLHTSTNSISYDENFSFGDNGFYSYVKGFVTNSDGSKKVAEYFYEEDSNCIEYLKNFEERADGSEKGILLKKVDGKYQKEDLSKQKI